MKSLIFTLLITAILTYSCSQKPLIKVDLDLYLKNQREYTGKDVVITAPIADIAKRYSLYQGKQVEISGIVAYYGSYNFWTWYILLEKDQQKIRCYAHQYRVEPGSDALHMVRWATSENDEITIRGRLRDDGIEMYYMFYQGDTVTPYYKPTDHYKLNYGLPWYWE
jgi:hypothetical protein